MATPREGTSVSATDPAARAERWALASLLGLGLLLLLAAAASGETGFTATRTDRFQASLSAGTTVRVVNVNGDVVATGGRAFSAVVTTTVTAPTRARAEEFLSRTAVEQSSGDQEYRLESRWPETAGGRSKERRRASWSACRDCRITARYEITLPPGVAAAFQTVNGELRIKDADGDIELGNVNGNIQVAGSRRNLEAQTVNGKVEAAAAALPADAKWDLQTVNGSVVATLPKDARFDWKASTMSGTISSTFAMPVAPGAAPAPPDAAGAPRRQRVIVREVKDGEVLIDAEELAREIEESFEAGDFEVRETFVWKEESKDEKHARRVHVGWPQRRYEARIGGGGAPVRASTMNGSILLLAAGTREADAKSLVSARPPIVVTVPTFKVPAPEGRVRAPRVVVMPPVPPDPEDLDPDVTIDADEEEAEVVRGDITGNFLSTSNASYRLGRVSGTVKILTHSGEIHVAAIGKGAELKTYGGDIRLGPIQGDLRAQTFAGDVRVGAVSGSATAETSGGDIRIERVAGAASARTGGGDIVIPAVGGGSVQAETGGGEVRIGILSRRVGGGITIRNAGGDVLLTVPGDFQAELDLEVEGSDASDDSQILSDFQGLAVVRGAHSERASGALNGGGPKVVVKTTSGSIRLRRGPNAGS